MDKATFTWSNGPMGFLILSEIAISTGGIIYVDDQIGQVRIVDFENYESLEKLGDTMYRPTDTSIETTSDYYIHRGLQNSLM